MNGRIHGVRIAQSGNAAGLAGGLAQAVGVATDVLAHLAVAGPAHLTLHAVVRGIDIEAVADFILGAGRGNLVD